MKIVTCDEASLVCTRLSCLSCHLFTSFFVLQINQPQLYTPKCVSLETMWRQQHWGAHRWQMTKTQCEGINLFHRFEIPQVFQEYGFACRRTIIWTQSTTLKSERLCKIWWSNQTSRWKKMSCQYFYDSAIFGLRLTELYINFKL
jgi:hypothetical protein